MTSREAIASKNPFVSKVFIGATFVIPTWAVLPGSISSVIGVTFLMTNCSNYLGIFSVSTGISFWIVSIFQKYYFISTLVIVILTYFQNYPGGWGGGVGGVGLCTPHLYEPHSVCATPGTCMCHTVHAR